jgi:DNA-directed RNA polymerase beta subunit
MYMNKPTTVREPDGSQAQLFPAEARLRNMTYASNLFCDCSIE